MRFGLLLVLLCGQPAFAFFQQDLISSKRRSAVEGTQWTLANWLFQKNKISLQNEWLAAHTAHQFFALVLGGMAEQYKYCDLHENGGYYQADMFFSLVNFYGEYQHTSENQEAYAGAAGFRLLGSSAQSTSLVVRYGWRHLNDIGLGEHSRRAWSF